MLDIIKHLIELIGKRLWIIVAAVVILIAALFTLTFNYPLSFKVSQCIQKEEQYKLHNTTYTLRSIVEKTGGASLRLSVKEVCKTVKDNLVEKP